MVPEFQLPRSGVPMLQGEIRAPQSVAPPLLDQRLSHAPSRMESYLKTTARSGALEEYPDSPFFDSHSLMAPVEIVRAR